MVPNIEIQGILYTYTFCTTNRRDDIPSVKYKLRFARDYGRPGWTPRNFRTKSPRKKNNGLFLRLANTVTNVLFVCLFIFFHHFLDLVRFRVHFI